ncbi:hypothetical protein U0027_04470 [Agrobacterium tumefaciens]|nr:hypothetical protein [Agrobacterium tumefaciens]WQE40777.1 hypothetical protein U0027_04470 [Agrobacterium tumefaciens]
MFTDVVWKFDVLVGGKTTVCINWKLGIPETIWVDKRFQRLLRDAKRFLLAYTILDEPRPATLIAQGRFLRKLILWMFNRHFQSFSQLDDGGRQAYFRYICTQYLDDEQNINVVTETIDGNMKILTLLFKHRASFDALPRVQIALDTMRGFEWGGAGRREGAKNKGFIPAVPEQVFNPLMDEALRWLEHYSDDIIRLLRIYEEAAENTSTWNSNNYQSYIDRRLIGFQFAPCPRTGMPWRPDIAPFEEHSYVDEEGFRTLRLKPRKVLRDLVDLLLAACSIVIQGFTGIRISEMLGLADDREQEEDLPSCVEVRTSEDGINDIFYIKGRIFKNSGRDGPIEGEWVVGVRPADSDVLPEVVRALNVALELTSGWRQLNSSVDAVFLYASIKGIGSLPRSRQSVREMLSDTMRRLQQQFLAKLIEISPQFSGWRLTSHQFRKKFAQDIVRCDPEALPAVREHFKHMSMHVLDSSYLGNDAELLKAIDDCALRDAAAQIMSIITGDVVGGKLADLIRKQPEGLMNLAPESLSYDERLEIVSEVIATEGVRAWPCDFGTCLFRAETALCHFAGKGFYDGSASRPMARERCADRCCRCSNLVVSTRHTEYWKARYVKNRALWIAHKEQGNVSWALLASRRAKVASTILKSLKVDPESLADAA